MQLCLSVITAVLENCSGAYLILSWKILVGSQVERCLDLRTEQGWCQSFTSSKKNPRAKKRQGEETKSEQLKLIKECKKLGEQIEENLRTKEKIQKLN